MFTDNGPVYFHHDQSVFGITPNLPATTNETVPIVPEDVISYVADLIRIEKETKAKLDEAKKALRMAMEQHGIKSWDSGLFKATIAADSNRATFDSARFKKDHPDLYEQYITNKPTKGGFTLK